MPSQAGGRHSIRLFAARAIRPFYVNGAFDGEAMSHYFFEAAA